MKNRLAFALLFLGLAPSVARADEPLRIASGEPQLFVDDFLIDTQADLVRTLRQPKKDDGGNTPVIALDKEFGDYLGTLEANGTIVYDPRLKKYVMLALAFSSPMRRWDRVRMYRFTSADGINWVKGDDGTPQWVFPTSTEDLFDKQSGKSASNIDLFSFFYDSSDAQHPYKGWLHFANWEDGREGQYYMYSADGIKWSRGQQVISSGTRKFQQNGRSLSGSGDVTTFYHDERDGRFLANLRFAGTQEVPPGNWLRSRAFLFVDQLDEPVDLNRVQRVALLPTAGEGGNGDQPFDEYYSSTAWRYGSMWLGALKIWHKKGDYPYSAADCAFFKLVSSRDGLNWKKVQFKNDDGVPEVFLPNGPHGGNNGRNDGGYMTEFSNPPLRIGDELIYYYGSSSWGKTAPDGLRVTGGGIFRARMRPDGFVSVDGGTLTTKPLAFDGKNLLVNGVGPIVVEALDAGGRKMLGKSALNGNSLQQEVRFDGREFGELAAGGTARLRFTVGENARLYSFTIGAPAAAPAASSVENPREKTETFDRDPQWDGVNNRSARQAGEVTVRQDFGFSDTNHAGGEKRGEVGGFVSQAGEVAYYAMPIAKSTFDEPLSASGTMFLADSGTHLLLGFFNAGTAKEWRTNNTIAMRINGRGDNKFFAYAEYCTSTWRAGGDTTPFPSVKDPKTARLSQSGLPTGKPLKWSLVYDPKGNGGKGLVTATIDGKTATAAFDPGHRETGATFDHFGILNVAKSADSGGEFFIDDVTVNAGPVQSFDADPRWDGQRNRETYKSLVVRPRFDFGFSPTQFAGGKAKGELGGMIFRGDCRYVERMACYGDKVGPLTLERPLRASGKIALRRGVTDSGVLLGFYNSAESMRHSQLQNNSMPETFLGVQTEGPSSEGFLFYPVYRAKGRDQRLAHSRSFPTILPDGKSHDWEFRYDPQGAGGKGRITVSLDGKSNTFDLQEGEKTTGSRFDRFGIVTTWIDGNSQDVYWDDVTYTVAQ